MMPLSFLRDEVRLFARLWNTGCRSCDVAYMIILNVAKLRHLFQAHNPIAAFGMKEVLNEVPKADWNHIQEACLEFIQNHTLLDRARELVMPIPPTGWDQKVTDLYCDRNHFEAVISELSRHMTALLEIRRQMKVVDLICVLSAPIRKRFREIGAADREYRSDVVKDAWWLTEEPPDGECPLPSGLRATAQSCYAENCGCFDARKTSAIMRMLWERHMAECHDCRFVMPEILAFAKKHK